MNANLERLSENSVKLTVEVSAEEFDKALDLAFEKVVKEVKADGFRPGKMPKNIFIQRFGWASLYNEAIQYAFEETYPLALQQTKVYPTAEPKVDLDFASLEKGKSFTYTAEVDVWPEVHLGEYKGLKVKPLSTRVTKKDVEAEIKHMLESKVENVIKDGPAENGDTVVIDFEGFVDGVPFEGGKAENYQLELGSKAFIPGFEDQLVGLKKGDATDVEVTFPEDYFVKELAGKEAVFKVNVQDVKRKELPELNDEYVAANSEYKTVAELKASYKERMQQNAENNAKVEYEKALIDVAVANAKFEVPEIMVEDRISQMVDEMRMSLESRKMTLEMYMQYTGMDMAKIRENQRATAAENVKTDLVLDAIAKAENIQVSMEDVDAELSAIAAQHGATLDEVKNIIKSNGNMGLLLANILRRKAAHVVIDNAK